MADGAIRALVIETGPGDPGTVERLMLAPDAGGVAFAVARGLDAALDRLAREDFDVLLVGLGRAVSSGIEAFSRLHHRYPELPVLVLGDVEDDDLAVAVVKEGAQDYLVTERINGPALLRATRYAVERRSAMERDLVGAGRGGCCLAFIGAKGGVGTTTVALNVAATLAARGRSTALAELRGRCGTLSALLDERPLQTLSHVADLGAERVTADTVRPALFRTPFGLDVLFGPQDARQETELTVQVAGALIDALGDVAEFTVADLPSCPPEGAYEAMRRAWRVVLVVESDHACTHAGRMMVESLRNAGVGGQLAGCIIVKRAALPIAPTPEETEEAVGLDVLGVVPPAAEACAAAQRSGVPVALAQPDSVVAAALRELTDRLTARSTAAAAAVW